MLDLAQVLQKNKCFKLVCGAGNEDIEQVKRLVYVYGCAGATLFDLSANEQVVEAAIEALHMAKSDGLLCVSVGIDGDPHICKANIMSELCSGCGACIDACLQSAISVECQQTKGKRIPAKDSVGSGGTNKPSITTYKCIGCGRCAEICPQSAILLENKPRPLDEVLAPLAKYDIAVYELHAIGEDDEVVRRDWQILCSQSSPFKSLCIDRSALGNKRLIARIEQCLSGRDDYTTIIQTDGTPMSGVADDYRTTLQAIATAELVGRYNLPAYILLSGGTNSNSSILANILNVRINGVALGSFARMIVSQFISEPDFWKRKDLIEMAITRAKLLVHNILNGVRS